MTNEKDFESYFKDIHREFKQGQKTELTFRSYLKTLIEKLFPELKLSEENKQIRKVGRPDFTCFKKGNIKVGYVETKDLGINLDNELGSEQLTKYSEGAIPNIILTNYTRFILYKNQEVVLEVELFNENDLKNGKATINEEKLKKFKQLAETFLSYELPTIKTANELAVELSKRAKLLRDLAKEQIEEDLQRGETEDKSSIFDFYQAFKELIKDITIDECIDAYSQTITYGLFLSKIGAHGKLNRDSAQSYIPSSIRIIKKIFNNITGDELPPNLSWIIDEIIDILNYADIDDILSKFIFEGKNYKDPLIHFYEDFLKEYDPEKRKHWGVYYTPEPIVSFITNSINEILKKEFDKQKGFADDSVKVLDFATGTGTFLANSYMLAIKELKEGGLTGIKNDKIKNHLLKDFYGFEILVSPYVISHLKLGILLSEEGYTLDNNERVQIYLTNTLDPRESLSSLVGFMKELTQETLMANAIKLEKPILVVMGNPPYSVSSTNNSEWISNLMKNYKENLEERNIQPLNDDYIKFIRFAQWKIEKNNSGIVGIISNNRYLEGVIHREMRRQLLRAFDRIYILNLHGSSKRTEGSEGKKDENVFNIQQGVAIALFIKNEHIKDKEIYYADQYGLKQEKYDFLYSKKLDDINWRRLYPKSPYYFFVNKDMSGQKEYSKNLALNRIFGVYTNGVKTHRDDFIVSTSGKEIIEKLDKLKKQEVNNKLKSELNCTDEEEKKFINHLKSISDFSSKIREYDYRPFDTRKIFYDNVLVTRHREAVLKNFYKQNVGLVSTRLLSGDSFSHVLCTEHITDACLISIKTSEGAYVFPLYVYNDESIIGAQKGISGETVKKSGKQPNFTNEFSILIEQTYKDRKITPEDVLGYIYAILHSPKYREKNIEFLKLDFPKIPFVKDYIKFKRLSDLGTTLIQLHLMKTTLKNIAKYEIDGTNTVNFVKYEDNKIFINNNQYFNGIKPQVWNYHIGSYKVLDKWLKGRKGKELTSQEIERFVKIVSILDETIKLMEEIDKIKLT